MNQNRRSRQTGMTGHDRPEYPDLIAQWLADDCEVAPGKAELGAVAYASFQHWCKQNGSQPFSNRRFSQKLVERAFVKTRTKSSRGWEGFECRQTIFLSFLR